MANDIYVLAEVKEAEFDYKNFGFRAANRRAQQWMAEVELKPNRRHRWNHGASKQTHRSKKGRRAGVKGC